MTTPRRLPEHTSPRNITELHPEELFDKLAQNQLSGAEARVLEDHLARCAACRAEREAREYFQQALAVDHGALELALGGALGRIAEEQAREPEGSKPLASPKPASARPRKTGRRRSGAVVVGVLLLAGAAAALGGVNRWQEAENTSQQPALAQTVAVPAAKATSERQPRPETSGLPQAPGPDLAAALPGAGLAATSRGQANAGRSAAAPIAAQKLSARSPKRAAGSPPVRPVPVGAPSASHLFRKANAARSQGRLERAEALYVELIRRYPDARESEAARALLAQLAMDHGSPDRALSAYDAYMQHGDAPPALREEALVGRARALQAMGDTERERQAWRELLRRFPKAAATGEAHQRLRALSDP